MQRHEQVSYDGRPLRKRYDATEPAAVRSKTSLRTVPDRNSNSPSASPWTFGNHFCVGSFVSPVVTPIRSTKSGLHDSAELNKSDYGGSTGHDPASLGDVMRPLSCVDEF